MLTQEQRNVFRELWRQRFGREISDEEADREGSRLVRNVRLICEPKTIDENKGIPKAQEGTKQQ